MKNSKVLKVILKTLAALVLLVVLSALILPFVFRKQIVAKVVQTANENLTAKVAFGDFGVSLFRSFPNFSVNLEQLSVAGTGAFEGDTLIKTDELLLTIDLMSVLRGDTYIIKKIQLDKPTIVLKTLKDGKVNWDITKPAPETAPETGTSSPMKLSIRKFNVNDGNLVYDDQSMGMNTRLADIDMTVGVDINGDLYAIDADTRAGALSFVYGGIPYLSKAETEVQSRIKMDMKQFRFDFSETELKLNQLVFGLEGWFAMPGEDMQMDLKFNAAKSQFKDFLSLIPALYAKDFNSVETKGSLAFDGYVKGTYNEKVMPAFGLNLLVNNAMFKYPSLPAAVENINVDVKIANTNGNPDNTVIDIRKAHLELAKNPVDIKMRVSTPVSDPNIEGSIQGKLNLADVPKFYPLEASQKLNGKVEADLRLKGAMSSIDKKQYEKFQADGRLSIAGMTYSDTDFPQGVTINELKLLFSPQFVDMPVADMRFGKSDLKASGKLLNVLAFVLKDEKLTGTFESRSNLIDLNEFMTKETTAATPADTAPLAVIKVPANIDFTAKTSIARLLYDNMDMKNINGQLVIRDETVTLSPFKMETLGGTLGVSGSYSSKEANPAIDFDLDVKHFSIPLCYKTFGMVKKLAPVAEKCSGYVNTRLRITSSLDAAMNPVYETLNGSGMVSTESVEVKEFLPMKKVGEALKMDKFSRIAPGNVKMEIAIVKGRLEVKPFDFTIDKIKTKMSGWSALDQSIGYDAVMEIPREMFGGQANAVLDGMVKKAGSQGVNIDPGSTIVVAAKITGTHLQPVVTTDIKKSVNSAVNEIKTQVTEKVKEEVQKVKEDVSAKAQKLIADAEKQAQQIKDEAKKAGDALIKEAEKQGEELVKKATNPITKAAAKESSKQLVKQAKNKSDKLQQEADKKAQQVIEKARAEAGKMK